MSTLKEEKPKAIYEPGELDNTRKNIGDISREEAMQVAHILGGEIGVEKAKNYSNTFPKKTKHYVKRGDSPVKKHADSVSRESRENLQKNIAHKKSNASKKTSLNALPIMKSQSRKLLDTIMMSNEYRIKQNYGFLSFVIHAIQRNQDKVSSDFISQNLNQFYTSLQKFYTSIQNMLHYATKDFNDAVSEKRTNFYKVIAFISEWNVKELEEQYKILAQNPKNTDIIKLIPFTKILFRLLLPLYYLGEETVIAYIKQMYTDNVPFLADSKEGFINDTKEAASLWIFIYGQVIKGMYPILLRMTSNDFVEYPNFYLTRNANILQFLNLSKFDIILPEKDEKKTTQDIKIDEKKVEIEKEAKQETEIKEAKPEDSIDSHLVAKGLDILDMIFPDAGWKNLSAYPDMYPYFQPIYNFADGFNLVAPSNPMQVTIVLHRILEDFFQALRNIKYSIDKEPEFLFLNDSISSVFSQWSTYREYEFERQYLPKLKEYVNQAYTQSDFVKTPYAKKLMSNFFWQTKYHFLPHMTFELIFMEKPDKDSDLTPLPNRINFLKQVYKTLINRVEQNKISTVEEKTKNDDIYGAQNLYQAYRFDIPNAISKRVDILLNKKKGTNAHNLNLIKYTLFILTVLDWWVNNKESPANTQVAPIPYRISKEDGSPVFYVAERTDLDKIFINNIKSKLLKKENAQKSDEGMPS